MLVRVEAWKRTFWSIFVANLVTAIGMMSFLPFFPVHLAELGLEDPNEIARWTGLCAGAAPFAAALMSPFWGALGDRVGRRAMVVRSMIAICVFVGAMAFARTPLELLCLRLGQGVFSGFIAPSLALVSLAAPPGQQGSVSGKLQSALAAGSILGPLFGSFTSATLGVHATYLFVSGAATLSCVIVLCFAREDPATRRHATGPAWRAAVRGWSGLGDFWRRAELRSALTLLFCVQFGVGAVLPLLHLYVEELSGPEDAEALTGVLFSAIAVVLLVATPLWGRLGDRVGHARTLGASTAGTAVALVLHAVAAGFASLVAIHVVLGLAVAGSNPSAFGAAAGAASTSERGSAFGLVFSARALARSIAAMVGGVLAAWVGLRGLFVVAGLLVALAVGSSAARARRAPAG